MDRRGGYYTQIANLYHLPLGSSPKKNNNEHAWYESRALEEIFILSGIAYLGLSSFLHLENNELKRAIRPIPSLTVPRRKKLMEDTIKNRLVAVNTVLPTEKDQIIGLIGLVGLGLLKIICPNNVSKATETLTAIQVLIRNDPTAFYIYKKYQQEFDGGFLLDNYIKADNFNALSYKAMKAIYNNKILKIK